MLKTFRFTEPMSTKYIRVYPRESYEKKHNLIMSINNINIHKYIAFRGNPGGTACIYIYIYGYIILFYCTYIERTLR